MKIDTWIERWKSKPIELKGIGKELYPDDSHAMAAMKLPAINTYREKYGPMMMHPIDPDFFNKSHTPRRRSPACAGVTIAVYLLEDLYRQYSIKHTGYLEVSTQKPMPVLFTCRDFEGWGIIIAPAMIDPNEYPEDYKNMEELPRPRTTQLSRWA